MMSDKLHPILTIITGKGEPNQAGIIEYDEHGVSTSDKVVGLRKAQQLLFQHVAAGDHIDNTVNTEGYTSIMIYDRRDFEATKARYEVSVERRKES